MESVFSDSEKRFILAEMIKLSQVDVGVIVDFVKAHGIQPNWMYMQLPGGRNMSQCVFAAETMFNTPMPPPSISSLKRKSLDDPPDYASKRQAILSPDELSPRGFAPGSNIQPASGVQPANIQPRPNGHALSALAPNPPSVSSSPYNPAPTGRRRGRPPKSAQSAWQVSTYQPIAPSTASPAPQPHSPGLQAHSPHQPPAQGLPDPSPKRKILPEIAPRPAAEPAARSPAVPGAEYQNWRDETTRREHYQVQASDAPPRDRPQLPYAPILPRPRSPLAPIARERELARPASAEPRRFTAAPPTVVSDPVKKETLAAAAEFVET